jgi:Lipase (class 3)
MHNWGPIPMNNAKWLFVLAPALALGGCASSDNVENDAEISQKVNTTRFAFAPRAEQATREAGTLSMLNAYWLARFTDLAYSPFPLIRGKLEAWGVHAENFTGFDNRTTGTQGFYLRAFGAGFLIFRGTTRPNEELADWLTNMDGVRREQVGPSSILAHSGFTRGVDSVWPEVRPMLSVHEGAHPLPLYIGGHSLGAALAVYAAYKSTFDGCLATQVPGDFRDKTKPWAASNLTIDRTRDPKTGHYKTECLNKEVSVTGVYTYGQPALGNEEFAETLDWRFRQQQTAYFRFVNTRDVVPSAGLSYTHVGPSPKSLDRVAYLSYDGRLQLRDETGRHQITIHRDCKVSFLYHHKVSRYVDKIASAANGTYYPLPSCLDGDVFDGQ